MRAFRRAGGKQQALAKEDGNKQDTQDNFMKAEEDKLNRQKKPKVEDKESKTGESSQTTSFSKPAKEKQKVDEEEVASEHEHQGE